MLKADDLKDTQVCIDGRWVIARPVNYKYVGVIGRLRDAIQVLQGKADAVRFYKQ